MPVGHTGQMTVRSVDFKYQEPRGRAGGRASGMHLVLFNPSSGSLLCSQHWAGHCGQRWESKGSAPEALTVPWGRQRGRRASSGWKGATENIQSERWGPDSPGMQGVAYSGEQFGEASLEPPW